MGYGELEKRMREAAKKEAEEHAAKAGAEAQAIDSQARTDAEEAKARIKMRMERETALRRRQTTGAATLEAMKATGRRRSELVEAAFAEARAAVLALPQERKEALMARLLRDADLVPGEKLVKVDPLYRSLLPRDTPHEIAEERLGDFGLIIESADGLVRIDNRLGTIIENAKSRMKPQVSKTLFG
jgi:vacuolar-type H+-ATPase subunit E/Vma4